MDVKEAERGDGGMVDVEGIVDDVAKVALGAGLGFADEDPPLRRCSALSILRFTCTLFPIGAGAGVGRVELICAGGGSVRARRS